MKNLISSTFLLKDCILGHKSYLNKGERQKRDKKKKRNDHILPTLKGLVIHSNIKMEEIYQDSRSYCMTIVSLMELYANMQQFLNMMIFPIFTFLLSKLSSCFLCVPHLGCPCFPCILKISQIYISCKKRFHRHPNICLPDLAFFILQICADDCM